MMKKLLTEPIWMSLVAFMLHFTLDWACPGRGGNILLAGSAFLLGVAIWSELRLIRLAVWKK